MPFSQDLQEIGLGIQALVATVILSGIHYGFKKYDFIFKALRSTILRDMLQVYALIWLLITIVLVNDLPQDLFTLAP